MFDVYIDYIKNEAHLHWEFCEYSKHGNGCHPGVQHTTGEWTRSFATITEALATIHRVYRMDPQFDGKARYCRDKCESAVKWEAAGYSQLKIAP